MVKVRAPMGTAVRVLIEDLANRISDLKDLSHLIAGTQNPSCETTFISKCQTELIAVENRSHNQ